MPFSALKVKLIDPTFINVYDFETLLKQFQHLFRTLLSHNQATFGVPLERHPLDFVEAHVKVSFKTLLITLWFSFTPCCVLIASATCLRVQMSSLLSLKL